MNTTTRVNAFIELGKQLNNPENLKFWAQEAYKFHNWFIEENVLKAFDGIILLLKEENLRKWLSAYQLEEVTPKKVGIVMAGNIPMVGFHDFLSVLICGHIAVCKISSQDPFLIKKIAELLISIEPAFVERIIFADQLKEIDAVIATGSDTSAKYFNFYFSKIPHIIRKNRVSVGVLNGNESKSEIEFLGNDILQYFGLGCRNISKIYVPQNYEFNYFFESINHLGNVLQHHKYLNNYDYNKSIYLINIVPHLDNGFLLLTENKNLVSPISVLYYERYDNTEALQKSLNEQAEKIQIIASAKGWFPNSIPFGEAQRPKPWDYADKVDTLKFLSQLKD